MKSLFAGSLIVGAPTGTLLTGSAETVHETGGMVKSVCGPVSRPVPSRNGIVVTGCNFRAVVGFVVLFVLILAPGFGETAPAPKKTKKGIVWIVFFSSSECPRCENVKDLLQVLKARYPMRVKTFDVNRESDYALFHRMEAIHAVEKFSVPVVMLGDSILMGEKEITDKLEETVRALHRSGGASLPYLGLDQVDKAEPKPASPCRDCEQKGRPPSASEEWGKVRKFIDRLF